MSSQGSYNSTKDVDLRKVLADTRADTGTEKPHPSPQDWGDQVLYFLLPDRFSDNNDGQPYDPATDKDNGLKADPANGIPSDDAARNRWNDAGKVWVGGNLKGIKRRLEYLQKLGVTAIWVGPVFKQVKVFNTYHGYGIQDFLDVDEHFGSRKDLQDLVKEAHERKIYVILDIILNHSGDVFEYVDGEQPWRGVTYRVKGFRDRDGKSDLPFQEQPTGTTHDAAVWPKELQDSTAFTRKGLIKNWDNDPEYLEGDFFGLKDIALGAGNPEAFTPTEAIKTLCKAYRFWISYADVDGFRIDTVKHMGKGPTRYFASVIHEYAQTIGKNNFFLVGEVTGGRNNAFDTVAVTGIDAALGIGAQAGESSDANDIQDQLEYLPKGFRDPSVYFGLFRDTLSVGRDSHAWFRNKVVTMLDDHDQIRKGDFKARYCANDRQSSYKSSILPALGLNLCTLGIPCIYYGSEQEFDGAVFNPNDLSFSDRYIRESMFGGDFGAKHTRNRHFFNPNHDIYLAIQQINRVRAEEIALRRGRQYLRDISGPDDGVNFGPPQRFGAARMLSVVPWSRVFSETEVLCAMNTHPDQALTVWVTVDRDLHVDGDTLTRLYSSDDSVTVPQVTVTSKSGRAVVKLTVPKLGFIIYK